uniref:Uncharacterized protein n=1 Tax=Arion vulgaris TaxID=1028688 RepID=A0A0B6ZYQ1_9EUPU
MYSDFSPSLLEKTQIIACCFYLVHASNEGCHLSYGLPTSYCCHCYRPVYTGTSNEIELSDHLHDFVAVLLLIFDHTPPSQVTKLFDHP